MRTILILLILLGNIAKGQENLVFNGSFEDFTPTEGPSVLPGVIALGNTAHIPSFSEEIACWQTTKNNGSDWKNTYIIVFSPDQPFFSPIDWDGTEQFWEDYYRFYVGDLPDYFADPYNAPGFNIFNPTTSFAPTNGSNYLTLITTPQDQYGHYTEINGGEVVGYAPDANSQDIEIISTLTEPINKGKDYVLSIDMAKIQHLNSVQSDNDKNPDITIKLKKSNGTGSKTIFHDHIENLNWQTFTEVFDVNSEGYDQIWIKLDRKYSGNVGVFMDNIQIYDLCETPENTCENPKLFEPLLNIEIEKIEQELPNTGGGTYILKTVHIHDLDVANHVEIYISHPSGSPIYRTIIMDNPPNDIMWDGKDDNGNVMPNGQYKCTVVASNLCYNRTFSKKFHKQGEIHLFDPDIAINDWGGVTITGLEDATFVIVEVENILTNIGVFIGFGGMPESEIGWNGSVGTNTSQYLSPTGFVESGYYRIIVVVQSDCGWEQFEKILFINEAHLFISYGNGNYSDPLYQWVPIPDKAVPECDYYTLDKPFYRVPKDCCVGDLYLDNEHLWGDMTFNILGTIHINNNVTFDPGSNIIMNAGGGFDIQPNIDGSAFIIASNVHLMPTVVCEPCDCNKSSELTEDTLLVEKAVIPVTPPAEDNQLADEEIKVSPNPASDFIMVSIPEGDDYTQYSIYNMKGELMMGNKILTNRFSIDISKLAAGDYIIQFTNVVEEESIHIIVY